MRLLLTATPGWSYRLCCPSAIKTPRGSLDLLGITVPDKARRFNKPNPASRARARARASIHTTIAQAMPPKKRKASSSPVPAPKSKGPGRPKVKKEDDDVKVSVKEDVKANVKHENQDSATSIRFDPLKSEPLPDDANWPAPAEQMRAATAFLQRLLPTSPEAIAPSADRPLVILPDKDADGLCSGQILHRTLQHLGVDAGHIRVKHLSKGTHVASTSELASLKALNPAACIVLDQGSRPGPPLLGPGDTTPVLVIDHHYLNPGEGGPENSLMVNASHSPPIATSSLLTWTICRPLWTDASLAESSIDWLAVLGTAGDLSVNVQWDAPMPDFSSEMKKWTKKRMGTAIALLNAPRRTPQFNVETACESLASASTPLELLDPNHNQNAAKLYAARQAVADETERCTHTPPKFAKDGRLAVLFIDSAYQIHPSIATRWSGALRGAKNLQVVMCANSGYSPHGTHTHFSCRRAGAAMKRGENPNIIEILHDYAARDPAFLKDVVKAEAELEAKGDGEAREVKKEQEDQGGAEDGGEAIRALNFARGHREASGGILPHALWKRFVELMEIGVPPEKSETAQKASPKKSPSQKTKLTSFFAAAGNGTGNK